MSKATIQYRGKEVTVMPGHRAVIPCYKRKMLGQVVVKVEAYEGGGVVPDGIIEIQDNGEVNVSGYATAKVNVQHKLQNKSVVPNETKQIINADTEYDGLSEVTVEAIATQEKTVTANGSVTADEGLYLKRVNVEVPAGSGASGTREIGENGEYNVKEYEFAKVNVQPPLQKKNVVPTEELQEVVPDEGVFGLSGVNIFPIPIDTMNITENGVHSMEPGKYMKTVTVNVPPPPGWENVDSNEWHITQNGLYNVTRYRSAKVDVNPPLQAKSVIPAAEAQEVTADTPNYGLAKVTVEAVPTESVEITTPVTEIYPTPGKFINKVKVNVPFVTLHSGASEPTDDIGVDGDIYLLLEE